MATPSSMPMGLSSVTATSLPRMNRDLKVPGHHLEALTTIIKNYNMVGKLAVHPFHSHEPLEVGEIKLENKLETARGKWMRPVSADSLDPASMHGLAFQIDHKGGENAAFTLVPYEFAKGRPSPIAKDDGTITLPQSMQKVGTLVPVSWPSPVVDPASQLSQPPPGQHWNEAHFADVKG
ncbi:hypothetical protein QQZ08_005167 [Neonectria magnoliae]|uniref:Uncharacterized protein n=1 Tax=Neonectria magnoliae TaxID=2732573 RepID=A0ABR1I5I7_9HYPO